MTISPFSGFFFSSFLTDSVETTLDSPVVSSLTFTCFPSLLTASTLAFFPSLVVIVSPFSGFFFSSFLTDSVETTLDSPVVSSLTFTCFPSLLTASTLAFFPSLVVIVSPFSGFFTSDFFFSSFLTDSVETTLNSPVVSSLTFTCFPSLLTASTLAFFPSLVVIVSPFSGFFFSSFLTDSVETTFDSPVVSSLTFTCFPSLLTGSTLAFLPSLVVTVSPFSGFFFSSFLTDSVETTFDSPVFSSLTLTCFPSLLTASTFAFFPSLVVTVSPFSGFFSSFFFSPSSFFSSVFFLSLSNKFNKLSGNIEPYLAFKLLICDLLLS